MTPIGADILYHIDNISKTFGNNDLTMILPTHQTPIRFVDRISEVSEGALRLTIALVLGKSKSWCGV